MRKPAEGKSLLRKLTITATSQTLCFVTTFCRKWKYSTKAFQDYLGQMLSGHKTCFPTYTTYTGHLENQCSRKVSFLFSFEHICFCFVFSFVRNLRSSNTAKFREQIEGKLQRNHKLKLWSVPKSWLFPIC